MSFLAEIAQELEQHQESMRMKKLIFYACKNAWENDPHVIDSWSLDNLIEELCALNPSIEQLKTFMYQVVETLNRPDVYGKIANLIINKIAPLYGDSDEPTQVLRQGNLMQNNNNDSDLASPEVLEQIATNIEYHEEVVRIKKLLFATCKHYWENEIETIDTYDLGEIILETRSLYPSLENLKKGIANVVSTLNRQNYYRFIADTILTELSYLYEEEEVVEATAILTQQILAHEQETLKSNQQQNQTNELDKKEETDLFDLKQQIIQYTNPLVAKILLFYTVYRLDSSEHHWSIVRTCSLNDLLLRLFRDYESIDEIESQLAFYAASPIEYIKLDENRQAASAIVKALKRFSGKIST